MVNQCQAFAPFTLEVKASRIPVGCVNGMSTTLAYWLHSRTAIGDKSRLRFPFNVIEPIADISICQQVTWILGVGSGK